MNLRCANCSNSIAGNFCSNCGQSVKSRRGPIWQVMGELFEEFFSLDSKFFTSIYALFIKPGHLTKQFIKGKRASILPPVRMYLVVSLLFFLIFQIDPPDVTQRNVYFGDVLIGKEQPNPDYGEFRIGDIGSSNWFSQIFDDRKEEMQQGNAQLIINRMFNILEDTLPNALILFLPILAVILKLLYFFKRILYIDHLLFALHFQTWLMCWAMIIYGMALINPWWAFLSAVLPVYLAIAQKRTYQQTYWLVIPKTLFIIIIYIAIGTILGAFSLLLSIILL